MSINKQYLNNTKIGRLIATKEYPDITDKGVSMKITITDNIVNLVNLKTDPNITLTDPNITQFDMAVMDAVYTIISAGVMVVTPEHVPKGNAEKNQYDCEKPGETSLYPYQDRLRGEGKCKGKRKEVCKVDLSIISAATVIC
mgnify:CR=1 FL=1